MSRISCATLLVLSAVCSLAAQQPPPPPPPVVVVDLAGLPHDTPVNVSAPVGATFKIEIRNRIPTAAYTITNSGRPTPVPALVVPPNAVNSANDAASGLIYTCPRLNQVHLGALCTQNGGTVSCLDTEEEIADEIERLQSAALNCGDAVRNAVDTQIRQYTRVSLTDSFSDRASLSIVRTGPPTVTWNAEVTTCDPVAQLAEFLKHEHPSDPMKVLAYDINDQLWTAYEWTGSGIPAKVAVPTFRRNTTGQPRLQLEPEEPLTVVVTNVNPIAYTATTTERTRTDIEDLATLKEMASLFADFSLGALKIGGNTDFVTRTVGGAFESISSMKVEQGHAFMADVPETADETLTEAAEGLKQELAPYVTAHAKRIKAVNDSSKKILKVGDELTERTTELASFVQRIEDHNVTTPGNFVNVPNSATELARAIDDLAVQREVLRKTPPQCADTLAAAAEIVQLRLQGKPEKAHEQVALLNRYLALLNDTAPPDNAADDDCLADRLREPLTQLHTWLDDHRPPAPIAATERETLVRISQYLNIAAAVATRRTAVLTAANEVMSKQPALAKATSSLIALTSRPKKFQIADPCALAFGVIELPRPEGRKTTIPWSSVQTETIKLSPEPALKDTIRLAHGETTAKYELARLRKWTFDTDVAAVYTDVVDPKFGIVDRKKADGTTEKVVDRVDESTRAGDVALMLTMRRKDRPVGAQLGFALNGYPAIFGGGAYQAGPYIKLSAGLTYQRVKTLAGGQKEGVTPLADAALIRTKDKFGKGWYAALSITVDDLPFFKKPG